MNVAVTWGASLVLTVVTLALASSHNRCFDVITGRSDRRWWLCQFGINDEQRRSRRLPRG